MHSPSQGAPRRRGRRAGKGSSPGAHFTHRPHRHPGEAAFLPSCRRVRVAAQVGVVTGEEPTGLGVHSLVGGMAVTDHLGQDPLLIPIHSLHPGSHLVSRFGHVVPRSWNGPTEGRGPEGGMKCHFQSLPCQRPQPRARPHLSPGFPIHRGRVMADCCSRVISTPLRMVFRGGSESLYTGPRSWPLWERSEPLRHQGQGSRPQAHPSLPASGCQSSACSPTAQVSTKGPGAIPPLPPDAHSQTAQMVRHQEGGYPRERELERAKAGIRGCWSRSIS